MKEGDVKPRRLIEELSEQLDGEPVSDIWLGVDAFRGRSQQLVPRHS